MKLTYTKESDIPKALTGYYVKKDGKFVLQEAEKFLALAQQEKQDLETKLERFTVERAALDAVTDKANIRKGATSIIMDRAAGLFKINKQGGIETRVPHYSKTGERLTLETWASELQTEADYLFEESTDSPKLSTAVADKKTSGKTISKSKIDGQSLHGDTFEAIANGTIKVV